MRATLLIILVLLLSVSCSGKKPSKTSFKLEMTNQGLNSAGGLVIFGKEQKGGRFARIVSSESVQVEIPKGTWNFGAIAWDGTAGMPISGLVICASQNGVSIDADEVTVNLTLNNGHCFDPAFSTDEGKLITPNEAKSFTPQFCEDDISGLVIPCVYDPLDPTQTPRKGFVGSFRIAIPGGSSFSSEGAGDVLESVCFNPSTGQDVTSTFNLSNINLPSIVSNLGLPLHIDAYLGAECEDEKGKFHLGFDDQSQARFHDLGPGTKRIYARTPLATVCSISDMMGTTDDFASGNGTTNYPNVICNENQFAYFSSEMGNISRRSANYILGRDLNLLNIIGASANAMDECLDDGDTLVPIGKHFIPITCVLQDYPLFTGVFDGNNRTVSHFRFKSSDRDEIGLFSQTSGTITNLNLRNVSIEGDNYVGSAVGRMISGGTLSNVQVFDADIRGNDFVGGIVGESDGALTIERLKVVKTMIEGTSDVGGVVGRATNGGNIRYAEFEGQITSVNSMSTRIGGIVGFNDSSMSRSVSSGVIRGVGTEFGGIVGHGQGGITYCRSDMLIIDHDPSSSGSRRIGGIAGTGVGIPINSSLFTGNILTSCAAPTCDIGGLKGLDSSTTLVDSYSVYQIPGLSGLNGTAALFTNLFTNAVVRNGLCTTFGAGCEWSHELRDLPRIETLDDDHFCADTLNNSGFAAQIGRGSLANPYIICNPDQLVSLSGSAGQHYSLRQNINLSALPANTIGNFNGFLSGNGHVIHSHTRTNSLSKGLFATVTGTLRDFFVSGTRFFSTGCPSCNDGVLAQNNTGTISNVHVTDASITTFDSNAFLGGIAARNSGIIEYSSFVGDLRGPANVGGIASENTGTVRNNISHPFIDISAGVYSQIGGIVAVNRSDVLRNTFRGEISVTSPTGGSRIGGVVGFLDKVVVVPRVIDNHVSGDAKILVPSMSVTNSGGIVGESDDATNIVSRNVHKSLLIDPTNSASVRPIVGSLDSSFNNNGDSNFALSTSYQFQSSSISPTITSYNSAISLCSIAALTSVSSPGTFGAFKINNQNYFGPITVAGNTYTLTIPTSSAARCLDFDGIFPVEVFTAFEDPDQPDISDYKDNNFDIADMSDSADRARVIAAYLSQISTGQPVTTPVWIFEMDDNEDVKLFNSID